jgi:hypothetical protein
LDEWTEGDAPKYLAAARELAKPERNTLVVSMKDVERHNITLANHITDDYYRKVVKLCGFCYGLFAFMLYFRRPGPPGEEFTIRCLVSILNRSSNELGTILLLCSLHLSNETGA